MDPNDAKSFLSSDQKSIFNKVFKVCNPWFKSNIKYISKPFQRAFEKARVSIAEIITDAVFRMDDAAGVLIFEENLVLYKLKRNTTDQITFYASIFFKKILVFSGIVLICNDASKEKYCYWVSDKFTGYTSVVSLFSIPLSYLVFMRFAETETKEMAGNQKVVVGNEKHKNETDLKIRVVGCEWITTIIRTEGFGVSGHFRFQPCGKDGSDRKLIWINPFQKNGYTRRAQIIINEEKAHA